MTLSQEASETLRRSQRVKQTMGQMCQQAVELCLHSNEDVSIQNCLSKLRELISAECKDGPNENKALLSVANELVMLETILSYYREDEDLRLYASDMVSIAVLNVSNHFLSKLNQNDDLKVHDSLGSVLEVLSWSRLVRALAPTLADNPSLLTNVLLDLLNIINTISETVLFDPIVEMFLFETLKALLKHDVISSLLVQNNRLLQYFLKISLNIIQSEHQEKLIYILETISRSVLFEELLQLPRLLVQMLKHITAKLVEGNLTFKAKLNSVAFICIMIFKFHPIFNPFKAIAADIKNANFDFEGLADAMVDYQAKMTLSSNFTVLVADLNKAFNQYVTINSLGRDFEIHFP